ncbi:MAG: substrate-binding domain-containing protein, partial [Blautia sp.]|nr:substrate-binding domain-containing protein [Blautia sp.]
TDTDTDTGTDADAGADTGNDADAGADADAVSEADSAADSGGEYRETEFQDPRVPVIDTSVKIMPGIRIAVVSKKVNGSFWTTLRKGMEAAVKDINKAYGFERSQRITMTFEGARDEQDVTKQINTLDAVLSENPGVLCLCASDVSSCQAQLEEARDNGIPVVTFDSTVADEDLVNAYRGTDNQKLGEIAAGKLAEAVGKKGKIAVFSEQQKTYSIQKRVEGFLSRMEDYPDITVLDVIYVDQVEDMAEEMNALRQGNPDLSGVYCTNADISDLYLDVIGKEETETVFVGTDGTEKQQKAVRDGKELGTVSQDPFAMGYETILTAAAFTQPPTGTFPEKISLMEPCWICQENLDDPANVGFLY